MTARKWKLGDVALVLDSIEYDDVRAGWKVRILAKTAEVREPVWWGPDGYLTQDSESIEEIRPLVVIDPEDREQVERLDRLQDEGYRALGHEVIQKDCDVEVLQAALREFAAPTPQIEEPTEVGARVIDHDGEMWVRYVRGEWACLYSNPGKDIRTWAELTAKYGTIEVQP